MKNEEKIQRNCFCCKLFERGSTYSLSSGGFHSWINIHSHLKEQLEDRLKSGKAIDSVSQELHVLETQLF